MLLCVCVWVFNGIPFVGQCVCVYYSSSTMMLCVCTTVVLLSES